MTKDELVNELRVRFLDVAQVYSLSPYKIEVDVSTTLSKEEWNEKIEGLNLVDNSKHIPDSWKCGDVTVQFFYGNISRFKSKNGL